MAYVTKRNSQIGIDAESTFVRTTVSLTDEERKVALPRLKQWALDHHAWDSIEKRAAEKNWTAGAKVREVRVDFEGLPLALETVYLNG